MNQSAQSAQSNLEELYSQDLELLTTFINSNNPENFKVVFDNLLIKFELNENCKLSRSQGLDYLEKFLINLFKTNKFIQNEIIDTITKDCKNFAIEVIEYYVLYDEEIKMQQGKLNNFEYVKWIFQTNCFDVIGLCILIGKLFDQIGSTQNIKCIQFVLSHIFDNECYDAFKTYFDAYVRESYETIKVRHPLLSNDLDELIGMLNQYNPNLSTCHIFV